ncbi:alkaline ceramidase 1 [Eublepharis macularius]|uniref:Alkaline ceramidase n=1 Tax=Eublepharis macularius TaxID=481883 RepID=A0AA97JHB0_EUBMA|nr:alkaline ceramidase 1 [Eublepharis macularius]
MPSIFAYLSAEVDWCEGNFEHSQYIAEYYNTVSNIIFFIIIPFMLTLNMDYMKYRPKPVHSLAVMVALIGFSSVYFHMTLSYVGQLLDELSILWTMGLCYACWFPTHHYPSFIKNREQFSWIVGIVTVVSTLMSFVRPVLNAYALNSVALHLLYVVFLEIKRATNPRIQRLGVITVIWWVVAISCWIVDKFFCEFCQKINFCYFHSLWHVFINIALTYLSTLIMYLDVLYEMPTAEPDLAYWPSKNSPISLPYLVLGKPHKWC